MPDDVEPVDLIAVQTLLSTEAGLCVLSLARPDGTVSSSLVNAGLLEHPDGRGPVLGLLARSSAYKTRRLRRDPRATLTVSRAWQWQAVEGAVSLIGPEDSHPACPQDALPSLLRAIFVAAGGTHDDWDHFDEVMVSEARTALLLVPRRVYGIAQR